MTHSFRSYAFPTLLLLIACPFSSAQTWDELLDGGGDAFDLPPGQITQGIGPLLTITGTIDNPDFDVDMYCIQIDDPQNFSATVTGATSQQIPQLWLFDQTGMGVAHHVDLNPTGGYVATLNSPFAPPTFPGIYFVAISRPDLDPNDAFGFPIFTPNNPTTQIGPNPLAGTVNTWSVPGSGSPGRYSIDLAGASYHGVPEPGCLTLFATGLLSLAARLRRRTIAV